MDRQIENYLSAVGVAYELYAHPAVFTVEELDLHCKDIPGMWCKNLFLKDSERHAYYLLVMPAKKKLDMKSLRKTLGATKLSFANEQELSSILGLSSGSVSPFGLLNDIHKVTRLVIDRTVWDAEAIAIHPNINTETLVLARDAFHTYVRSVTNNFSLHDIF